MAAHAEPAADTPVAPARPSRHARRLVGLVRGHPFALAGVAVYAAFLLVAVFADRLAAFDPTEILFQPNGRLAANLRPSAVYLLGTTNLGRDIFSQLVFGTRTALAVGLTAATAVVVLGTVVGRLRGEFRAWIRTLLM